MLNDDRSSPASTPRDKLAASRVDTVELERVVVSVLRDITQDAVIDGTAADGAADLIARDDVALLSGDARLAADLLIKASGR